MKTGIVSLVAYVFLFAATLVVAGCDDNTAAPGFDYQSGALGGELAVYVADDFEGRSELRYALRSRTGDERALHFDSDPGLKAGSMVKIWGTQAVDGIRVSSFQLMAPPVDTTTSALIAGTRYNPKRLAFVIVDLGSGVGTWTLDRAQAELSVAPGVAVAVSDPPLRNYYVESSYGTQDLDGRAFSLSYPMTACNTSAMATALKPMVMSMGGGAFNHYLWFFGTRLSACSWGGLGEVGTPERPSDDTWYNNSAGCVVMVQEPGHNFGMQHSSSMRCGSASFADAPTGPCTHSEYGDRFDPMGGACDHMNGWQKAYNGWLQGCNVVSVKSSGTFTLVPLELPCDGVQMLQIPMPKTTRTFMRSGGGGSATNDPLTHYYLELRTPRSLDTGTPVSVQVRVSGAMKGRTERAVHTWMLDMNPATTQNNAAQWEGLVAGGTFTDPAGGVSFTVTEIDMNHANVTVTMDANGGGPTCLGGAAFTAPGPSIESCSAAPSTPDGAVGGATGSTGGAPGTGGRGTGGAGGRGVGGAGVGGAGVGGRGTGGAGTGGAGTGGRGTGGAGTGGAGTGGAGPIATGGAGTGGSPAGTGGIGPIGSTGGSPGAGTGGGRPITPPPDVTGGCACAIDGNSSSLGGGALALLALVFVGGARRRRRGHR